MRTLRIVLPGIVALLSASVVFASVTTLLKTPKGEIVFASFAEKEAAYQIVVDKLCVGEFTITPAADAIFVKGRLNSAEAGKLDLSFGLVFNQLSQLSSVLGVLGVESEEILKAEIKGVTPLEFSLQTRTNWPLPQIPPIPVMITRFSEDGRVKLVVKGLSPARVSASSPLDVVPAFLRRIEVVPSGNKACQYSPFSINSVQQWS